MCKQKVNVMNDNLLRPNSKLYLVNEIIRLRVLNNTPVDFEKIKPSNDIKEWLYTHSGDDLFDIYKEQLRILGGK